MDEITFEKFEKINAEIDILIDEEEYEEVQKLLIEYDTCLLKNAFPDNGTCTFKLDEEWIELLGSETLPIKSINNQDFQKFNENNQLEPDWSRFFWAKLIRAKIQEKGTTCFFRRTDDVVAYLERNLPVITKDEKIKKQILKLTVIYLLEMAACGTGADIRGFAERARSLLRGYFKNNTFFYKFYDLLARYNIGVSHFHEAMYRKAALAFNYIIDEIKKFQKENNSDLSNYFHIRQGDKLLYYPSFKFRATLQSKLQLAYHAVDTITKDIYKEEHFKSLEKDKTLVYYKYSCDLIMAEAYLHMGNHKQSKHMLKKVADYLLYVNEKNNEKNMDYSKLGKFKKVKILSEIQRKSPLKRSNLYGRLLDLLVDEKLDEFEKLKLRRKFNDLNDLFIWYELYVRDNKEDRTGYLQQISKFLNLLVDNYDENEKETHVYRKWANEIYNHNKNNIIETKKDNNSGRLNSHSCLYEKKGDDLERLRPEHYDECCKNIRKFYSKMQDYDKRNDIYKDDKDSFLKKLIKLEEKGDNRSWFKRGIKIELNEELYSEYKDRFCETCIDKKENAISFNRLLHCENTSSEKKNSANASCLSDRDYEQIMGNWDEHFLDHLKHHSCHDDSHDDSMDPQEPRYKLHFIGLQRWNSSSPAKGSSLGGGYLLYCADKNGCVKMGVAIDPGFDFIKNLFHEGFSLRDINFVLLSHAHLDHVRDFETMVTLLLELRKRTNPGEIHKIHAIMTLGIYSRLEHIITNPGLREFIDPYIIDIKKEIDENFLDNIEFIFYENVYKNKYGDSTTNFVVDTEGENSNEQSLTVTIKPTRAYHNDFSQYSDSYGYKINIKGEKIKCEYNFGYTGDTSWDPDVMESYIDCNTLLVHLGSLIGREDKNDKLSHYNFAKYNTESDECYNLVKEKKHPYFVGMLHFLIELVKKKRKTKTLVLMSEFGEELRGKIRIDFVAMVNDTFHKYGLYTLPVDVGLDVLLKKRKNNKKGPWVKCVLCDNYILINRGNVDYETYGLDEGLFCVCKTCMKSVSTDVKIDKLRQLYEIGHEFRKCNEEEKFGEKKGG